MKVLNFEDSVYKANAIRKILGNRCSVASVEQVGATEFCVEELKALSKGKSGLDSTVWSWEKPENISHEKLNQKLNAKIENM